MSLNHSVKLSQFANPTTMGGRLENVHYDQLLANEFFVENLDVTGNIVLGNSTTITQNGNIITPSVFNHLSKINQDLSTLDSPHFNTVNADLYGLVTLGEQKEIISLPQLSAVQDTAIPNTVWPFVATMNQNVATNSSPSFSKLTIQSTNTNTLNIKNAGGSLIVQTDTTIPKTTFNCDVLVNGNITYNTITELKTVDPMIALADGNLTNNLDIGFYGTYSASPPTKIFTGLFRNHATGYWTFFDNLSSEPSSTVPNTYTLATALYNKSLLNDGSVSSPSYSFANDLTSGLYRIGTNNYGFSIASTKILDLAPSALSTINLLPLLDNTYDIGSTLVKYANGYINNIISTNLTGTLQTATQPNITSLASLNSIQGTSVSAGSWQYVNTLNQNVSTSSSPSFTTVTANLIGNVTGNVSGSAATVTNASQPSITTLPNLASIQGQTISSVVWPFISTLNQNLATTSAPSFSGITVNTYSLTAAAQYLSTINQSLTSTSSPSFNTVIADLIGNVTGNISGSAATVTNANQPAITTLPNLASVQGQLITSTAWQYVNSMNQSVASGASPSFVNVTATTAVKTNSIIPATSGSIDITPTANFNTTIALDGGQFNVTAVNNSTINLGSGVLYINPSRLVSIGTTSNPNSRTLYVNGAIEVLSGLYGTIMTASQPNITEVGTITTGVWNGTAINGQYINYNTTNLRVIGNQLNTIQDLSTSSLPTFRTTTISGDASAYYLYASLLLSDTAIGGRQYALSSRNTGMFVLSDETMSAVRLICNSSGNVSISSADDAGSTYKFFVNGSTGFTTTMKQTTDSDGYFSYQATQANGGTYLDNYGNMRFSGGSASNTWGVYDRNGYAQFRVFNKNSGAGYARAAVGSFDNFLDDGNGTIVSNNSINCGGSFAVLNINAAAGTYSQLRFNPAGQTTNGWTFYTSASTSTPSITLQSGSNYLAVSWDGTSWVGVSDRREKHCIETYTDSVLDKINALRMVKYHSRTEDEKCCKRVGFIAQEVQEQIPELVESMFNRDGDERFGIKYGDIGKYCVKAIQELKAIIDAQAATITALTARVTVLEAN